LHRKLKALTGCSTANYIRSRRLFQARQLIESTDLPIGEIAEEVGFKDFSHFSRRFAIEFGRPPTDFRR
jgi:AraC-like DNA-binding protein